MELFRYYNIEKKSYKKGLYYGLKINGWKQYIHCSPIMRTIEVYLNGKRNGPFCELYKNTPHNMYNYLGGKLGNSYGYWGNGRLCSIQTRLRGIGRLGGMIRKWDPDGSFYDISKTF